MTYCRLCKSQADLHPFYDNHSIPNDIQFFLGTEEIPQNGEPIYTCDTCLRTMKNLGKLRKWILDSLRMVKNCEPFRLTKKTLILSQLDTDDFPLIKGNTPTYYNGDDYSYRNSKHMKLKKSEPYCGHNETYDENSSVFNELDIEIQSLLRKEPKQKTQTGGGTRRRRRRAIDSRQKKSRYKSRADYARAVVSRHLTHSRNSHCVNSEDDSDSSRSLFYTPPSPDVSPEIPWEMIRKGPSPAISERSLIPVPSETRTEITVTPDRNIVTNETNRMTRLRARRLQKELGCNEPQPIVCDKCDENFDSQDGLEAHQKRLHYQYFCSVCNEKFEHEIELRRHRIAKHYSTLHECQFCNYRYQTEDLLDRHKEKYHANQKIRQVNYRDQEPTPADTKNNDNNNFEVRYLLSSSGERSVT